MINCNIARVRVRAYSYIYMLELMRMHAYTYMYKHNTHVHMHTSKTIHIKFHQLILTCVNDSLSPDVLVSVIKAEVLINSCRHTHRLMLRL